MRLGITTSCLKITIMELLLLGLVVGVGAAKRKEVTKAVYKSYMAVSEKTKEVTSNLKEDMRDAVEEARREQDIEILADASYVDIHNNQHDVSQNVVVNNEVPPKGEPSHQDGHDTTGNNGHKAPTNMLKGLAKSMLAVSDRTRSTMAHMREEMRDAIEEARFEHEQKAMNAEVVSSDNLVNEQNHQHESSHEEIIVAVATPEVKTVSSTPIKSTVTATSSVKAGDNSTPVRRPHRRTSTKLVEVEVAVEKPKRSKPKTNKVDVISTVA